VGASYDDSVTSYRHFFDCVASLAVAPCGSELKKGIVMSVGSLINLAINRNIDAKVKKIPKS